MEDQSSHNLTPGIPYFHRKQGSSRIEINPPSPPRLRPPEVCAGADSTGVTWMKAADTDLQPTSYHPNRLWNHGRQLQIHPRRRHKLDLLRKFVMSDWTTSSTTTGVTIMVAESAVPSNPRLSHLHLSCLNSALYRYRGVVDNPVPCSYKAVHLACHSSWEGVTHYGRVERHFVGPLHSRSRKSTARSLIGF